MSSVESNTYLTSPSEFGQHQSELGKILRSLRRSEAFAVTSIILWYRHKLGAAARPKHQVRLPHPYVPHKPLLGHIRLILALKEISEGSLGKFIDVAFLGSFTTK